MRTSKPRRNTVQRDLNVRVRLALTRHAAMLHKPIDEIGWIADQFRCTRESAERLIRDVRK